MDLPSSVLSQDSVQPGAQKETPSDIQDGGGNLQGQTGSVQRYKQSLEDHLRPQKTQKKQLELPGLVNVSGSPMSYTVSTHLRNWVSQSSHHIGGEQVRKTGS